MLTLVVPGALFGAPPVRPPRPPIYVQHQYEASVPEAVQRALVDFGGLNPFGAPNYRLVWGWTRGDWFGGEWRPKYVDKFRHLERWHLEKWVPSEMYGTPEQWYASAVKDVAGEMVNVLGDYPSNGGYERVIVFENYHTGEYVEPSVDLVYEAITRNRQHASQSRGQIARNIKAEQEKKERAAEAEMDEAIDANEAAFPFKVWMPASGAMTPESRRRDTWHPGK